MQKKGMKLIACMLVFMLTMSYLSVIGEVIATNLEEQPTTTNNPNVEFDAYFMNQKTKIHSQKSEIGDQSYLYTAISVKNAGYLKNAEVSISDANFKFNNVVSDDLSKIKDSKVCFRQINNGNNVVVGIPISIVESNLVNTTILNQENKVKLTGTYVDGQGNENPITKDIIVQLGWIAEKKAELNTQVMKFVPYQLKDSQTKAVTQEGMILQVLVESNLKDNNLPVKESKIEVSTPQMIEDYNKQTQKLSSVQVQALTTNATNGDEKADKFTNQNYTYDATNQKIVIDVKNEANTDGKVSWKKNVKDQFLVTYIFTKSNSVSVGTQGQPNTKIIINSEITTYEASSEKATANKEQPLELNKKIGELVDFEITSTTQQLGKGQIYANYESQTKKDTEYKEIVSANVSLAKISEQKLIDKLIMQVQTDNFVKEDESKLTTGSNTYYKEIKLNKAIFTKVLGEEGQINIYDSNSQLIATMNKTTNVDSNGNMVNNISSANASYLRIETTAPIAEGKLTFEITKAIKGNISYTKTQMQTISKVEMSLVGEAEKANEKLQQNTFEKEIEFVEPETKVELTLSNPNLSTVVTNENVKLTSILKTDIIYCNLFKDPILEITLPNYIEKINIKKVEVLFDNEESKLNVKNYNVLQNTDGTKTIKIELEGTQTEYSIGAISKGTNVVVTADITCDNLTPSKQDQIVLKCTNAMTGEQKYATANANFTAPVGLVTTQSIENYQQGKEKVTVINKENTIVNVGIMEPAKNANFQMNVINNYANAINNVVILGRTGYKGNKNIETQADLGSTVDMPLTSAVAVSNIDANRVKVYYTSNGEATKDLNNAANGWTLTPADLSEVKSYLIVIDGTIDKGNNIQFGYTAQIPENMQYNETSCSQYQVYFNNNSIEDKELSAIIGITTGSGPILQASMEANVDKDTYVLTDEVIKYTLKVKNIGTEIANNVIAIMDIPEGLQCVEPKAENPNEYTVVATTGQIQANIGEIAQGQTKTVDIYMQVKLLSKDLDSKLKAVIKSDNASQVESNEVTNKLGKKAFATANWITKDKREVLTEGYEFIYNISMSVLSAYDGVNNTVVNVNIPQQLEFKGLEIKSTEDEKTDITKDITYNYDETTGNLTINLGKIVENDKRIIKLKVKTQELPEGIYSDSVNLQASINGDNIREQFVHFDEIKIGKPGFKITQTASIPENSHIEGYEDFKYIFTIENLSDLTLSNVKVTDILPEEVILSRMTAKKEIGTDKTSSDQSIDITFYGKEKVTLEVDVVAEALTETRTITNKAKIEYQGMNTIVSPSIKHIIEKFDDEQMNIITPTDPINQTKRITGQIWEDSNANGARDEKEIKLSNVEVMLFNNNTGDLARDASGKAIKSTTNENGIYTLGNIPKGRYTVIYLYDSSKYSSTTYRKEGVDSNLNSDGVDTKIVLDGKVTTVAITEEIVITDSNVYNVDLGLVSNPKFDLKLDKTVSSITVKNSTGTTVYDYADTKLAKRDLVGKQINDTTIIVEYKMKVTNEGAISGYVKKIVDYIPEEMKFSSELNQDWYIGENGKLYNASLANTLINPGESKEVTLILTKKMSDSNLGIYHNEAEIYEAYNDLGIEDIDSTPANKTANEDDISTADVLITVKTGEVFLYTGLAIAVVAIVGVSIYFIKKKVIN